MKTLAMLVLAALTSWGQVSTFPDTGGASGSGTVTSVASSCGITGGTITTSGTLSNARTTSAQTGTTYAVVTGDCAKLVTTSNAAAITLTIPAAGGSFTDGFFVDVLNIGAGTVTCSGATCTLTTGQSARFVSTGATWRVLLGAAASGSTITGCSSGLSVSVNDCIANVAILLTQATDQAGTPKYCRSTTGNATYTCALTPTLTAYTRGGCLTLDANFANVTTATLNIDTLGAKSILTRAGAALAAGDITADKPIGVCYDGTSMIIQGDGGGGGGGSVSLTTGVTGVLPVANGGSGAGTFTANGTLIGNGTGAFGVVAPGTATHVLTSNGSGAPPSYQAASGGTPKFSYAAVGVAQALGTGATTTACGAITGATTATPIVVTCTSAHGLTTGDEVYITGAVGITGLNNTASTVSKVTSITSTTFSVQGSVGGGTWTSGGTAAVPYVAYFRPTGTDTPSTAENLRRWGAVITQTVTNAILYNDWNSGQPSTGLLKCVLRINGVSSAVAIIMPPSTGANTQVTWSGSQNITAGDLLGWKCSNFATTATAWITLFFI